MVNIVPDEAEVRERLRSRHQRLEKLSEGKSKRFKRRMERIERTDVAHEVPRVRVLPKNDEWRKIMVHPSGNLAFPEHGSVEWPLDQFTLRRLRDGDVTLDESQHQQVHAAGAQAAPAGAAAGHHEYQRRRRPDEPKS